MVTRELALAYTKRTYRGKSGCMCGCIGTYSDKGTRTSKMRIKALSEMSNKDAEIEFHSETDGCVYFDNGKTTIVAFFSLPAEFVKA